MLFPFLSISCPFFTPHFAVHHSHKNDPSYLWHDLYITWDIALSGYKLKLEIYKKESATENWTRCLPAVTRQVYTEFYTRSRILICSLQLHFYNQKVLYPMFFPYHVHSKTPHFCCPSFTAKMIHLIFDMIFILHGI